MDMEKEIMDRCKELIKSEHSDWIGLKNQEAIEKLINYVELMESEFFRLEDIEDRKVQLEYQFIEDKINKKWQDKITKEIENWDMSIKWNNSDDWYYAMNILRKLLKE